MADSLILTNAGLAKLAVATPESPLQITSLAVGDGNGGYPTLSPAMTALAREVWRGTASAPIREPDSPTVLKFETIIPADEGGFFIRELGLFDSTGALIAIAQCSVVEKPSALASTALTMTVTMRLALSNASQTQVVINDQPYIDHQALSNRRAQDAHPMASITGLTGYKKIAAGGALPATASGAYEIVSALSSIYAVLPKIADLAADVELLFFSSPSSAAASYVVANPADAMRRASDVTSAPDPRDVVLPSAGDWVRVRSNKAAGEWVVVASATWRKDPTEVVRGLPLVATDAMAEAGVDNSRMLTSLRATRMLAGFAGAAVRKAHIGPAFVKKGPASIRVAAGVTIYAPGIGRAHFAAETDITMPPLNIGDYSIWLKPSGSLEAVRDTLPDVAAAPAQGAVKVGGFHYGAVAAGTTLESGGFNTTAGKASDDFVWKQTALDLIVGINAHSIWDLQWRPKCDPRGMTCVTSEFGAPLFWVDIYLCNTAHLTNGTSKHASNVASGTVRPLRAAKRGGGTYGSLSWFVAVEIAFDHGKRLLSYQEFAEMAYGVTEAQSIGGTESTIPATARQAGYTSRFGVEQATGHHWVYGSLAPADSGTAWVAGAQRGQTFGTPVRAIFGGTRFAAAYSGSRCAYWADSAWYSHWGCGLRAACDHLSA